MARQTLMSDHAFLRECFIDTGDIELLLDCNDHRRIVLGRTGSGKTALLAQLSERTNRVINIKPESLALAYISNSTILPFVVFKGWVTTHPSNTACVLSFLQQLRLKLSVSEHASALW